MAEGFIQSFKADNLVRRQTIICLLCPATTSSSSFSSLSSSSNVVHLSSRPPLLPPLAPPLPPLCPHPGPLQFTKTINLVTACLILPPPPPCLPSLPPSILPFLSVAFLSLPPLPNSFLHLRVILTLAPYYQTNTPAFLPSVSPLSLVGLCRHPFEAPIHFDIH